MALNTPSTAEIADLIIDQLESKLNQTIPLLPKSFNRVLSKALAAVFILLYKYGGFIFLQIFVETATIDDTTILGETVSPLKAWGRLIGVGDPGEPTSAELIIDITVNTQTGTLDSGTQLTNSNNGVTYITVGAVLLNAPVVQATIKAVADTGGGDGSGVVGNLEDAAEVSFANPLSNVNRVAVVASTSVTGADGEDVDVYRQRIIDRFQKRPQGGAYADYESWGLEVPGIVSIYPYTADPGFIDVYVEATVESSGSPDGIPTQPQLDAVLASIDLDEDGLATRRPASAFVETKPITRTGFDVEVFNLVVENEAEVQAAVEAALTDFLLQREPYVIGLARPPRLDRITQSAIGGQTEAIVSAAGGIFDEVLVRLGTLIVTTHTLGEGEKAKLESITFT